jgi:hypothetical protein
MPSTVARSWAPSRARPLADDVRPTKVARSVDGASTSSQTVRQSTEDTGQGWLRSGAARIISWTTIGLVRPANAAILSVAT